jgi:FkbM family methyltransferase
MFESLRRTLDRGALAQVNALNLALSDRTGELTFYRARDGFAGSLVPEVPGHESRYLGETRVRAERLDDLLGRNDVRPERVALVKVDVEGEEARTLAGTVGFLRAAGLPPVWCEVRGPRGSRRAPGTFAEVLRVLAPLGYRAYRWNGTATAVGEGDIRKREDILFRAGAA